MFVTIAPRNQAEEGRSHTGPLSEEFLRSRGVYERAGRENPLP